MDASTLVIKVKNGDMLRRFRVISDDKLSLSILELRKRIISLFNLVPNTELMLSYVDGNEDEVDLVDDEDLLDALEQALNPLIITIKLNENNGRQRHPSPWKSPFIQQQLSSICSHHFSEYPVENSSASQSQAASSGDGSVSVFDWDVGCDGCGVHPITGTRFKSKEEIDYNLCIICFRKMGTEKGFIRMDRPAVNPPHICHDSTPGTGLGIDQELDIAFNRIAPELPGEQASYGRMKSPTENLFEPFCWIHIQVDANVKMEQHKKVRDFDLNLPPWSSTEPQTMDLVQEMMASDSLTEPDNSNHLVESIESTASLNTGNLVACEASNASSDELEPFILLPSLTEMNQVSHKDDPEKKPSNNSQKMDSKLYNANSELTDAFDLSEWDLIVDELDIRGFHDSKK